MPDDPRAPYQPQSGTRMKSTPIPVSRSRRTLDVRAITSFMPGKMVPVCAFPLLREDKLSMSRFRLNFEQMETAELLANAVNCRVMAYLVPNLAFDRFEGIDSLNRSYQNVPDSGDESAAGTKIPFFPSRVAGAIGTNAILKALGKHIPAGATYNPCYEESYNVIWNFRAANRTSDIALRLMTDQTLAPAFWSHSQFAHIVPDFDQATIEGEVPLTIASGAKMPVSGLGLTGSIAAMTSLNGTRVSPGAQAPAAHTGWIVDPTAPVAAGEANLTVKGVTGGSSGLPDIFAELSANGITVSLANIELARRTQAFAALRKQYSGLDDDYIIDLLMNGITVPEQAWRQPILLADKSTIFGMAKRYSSDSVDLTASVVNGATFVDIAITTPQVPTGGIVMICVEITPEQLYERQKDHYMFLQDTALLPEFLRDTLDPEKVEIVKNSSIDVYHATPTGTFGYAPLNWAWNQFGPHVGGKFFRPTTDTPTFDEDRQRFWACETANPTLSRDFYLCTSIHTKPFVVTNQDPYEMVLRGIASIDGNTVFGRMLIPASDDYNKILAEAPITPITKP